MLSAARGSVLCCLYSFIASARGCVGMCGMRERQMTQHLSSLFTARRKYACDVNVVG